MNDGALLALALIAVPMAGALLSLVLRRRTAIVVIVAATAVLLVLCSLGLFLFMEGTSNAAVTVEPFDIYPVGLVLMVADFLLFLVFLYIGVRSRSYWVIGATVINILLTIYLVFTLNFTEASPVFFIDNLSLILALITSMVGSVIAIYSLRYMRDDPRQPAFFATVLLFIGSMNAAMFSNDMLWMFLFWDITTLCSFLLIGHTRTDEARRAAIWALILTLGGCSFFVAGAVAAQHYYGTVSFRDLPITGLSGLALLPLSLFAVAAFTKSAQLPFQSWLLGAMVAPTPVSALLHSATMVNLGVYLLLRMSPSIAGAAALNWVVALIGGGGFLAATFLAITQSNSKRVLAWSTVANLGLMTMCVGISTSLAITAAVILLLYHAISKALMFLSVGVVKERVGSEDIEAMQGIRTTLPFASLAIFIGIITIVLPPFGMFASKWLISEAAVSFPLLIFLLAAGFAATFVFYFKWIGSILLAGPGARSVRMRDDPTPRTYKWTVGALMVGAVGLSVLIDPVLRYLIFPFVASHFVVPVSTNGLTLITELGEFPVFLFLLFVALIFAGLAFIVRPIKEEISTPYAGGEDFQSEFEARSNYYLSAASVARVIKVAEGAGILLIIILLIIPLLLEVL